MREQLPNKGLSQQGLREPEEFWMREPSWECAQTAFSSAQECKEDGREGGREGERVREGMKKGGNEGGEEW